MVIQQISTKYYVQVLWAKMESEEVGFQIAAEGCERICGSDCNGKCIPKFWGQKGEEFGTCGALLSRRF